MVADALGQEETAAVPYALVSGSHAEMESNQKTYGSSTPTSSLCSLWLPCRRQARKVFSWRHLETDDRREDEADADVGAEAEHLPNNKQYPELCGYDQASICSGISAAASILMLATSRRGTWLFACLPQPSVRQLRQAMAALLFADALVQTISIRRLLMFAATLSLSATLWKAHVRAGVGIASSLLRVLSGFPTPSRSYLQRAMMAALIFQACIQYSLQTLAVISAATLLLWTMERLSQGLHTAGCSHWLMACRSWIHCTYFTRIASCCSSCSCQPRRLLLITAAAEVLLTLASRPLLICALLRAIAKVGALLAAGVAVTRLVRQPAVMAAVRKGAEALVSPIQAFAQSTLALACSLQRLGINRWQDPWEPSILGSQMGSASSAEPFVWSGSGSASVQASTAFPALPAWSPCLHYTECISAATGCATALRSFACQARESATAIGHSAAATFARAPHFQEMVGSAVHGRDLLMDSVTTARSIACKVSITHQPASQKSRQCDTEMQQAPHCTQRNENEQVHCLEKKGLKIGQKRGFIVASQQKEDKFAAALQASQKRRKLCGKAVLATTS